MSSFLSSKYLRYADPRNAAPIDEDLPCPGCGYNVRGLNFGRNCPECGTMIQLTTASPDVLVRADLARRQQLRIGLALCTGALFVLPFVRLSAPFINPGGYGYELRMVLFFTLACAWVGGVILATPPYLDADRPRMRSARRAVRITQPLWLLGVGIQAAGAIAGGTGIGPATRPAIGVGLVGGLAVLALIAAAIGVLLFASMLRVLAEDASLDGAARRFNAVMWVLGPVMAIMSMVPGSVPWTHIFVLMLFMLGWAALIWTFAWGFFTLERHVTWSIRLAVDAGQRDQRITERRAAIDEEVLTQIRPLPSEPPAR